MQSALFLLKQTQVLLLHLSLYIMVGSEWRDERLLVFGFFFFFFFAIATQHNDIRVCICFILKVFYCKMFHVTH